MKATTQPDTKEFTPFTLSIQFDTAEEVNALYYLLNEQKVCDYLRGNGVEPGDIRESMEVFVTWDEEEWAECHKALNRRD